MLYKMQKKACALDIKFRIAGRSRQLNLERKNNKIKGGMPAWNRF